MVKDWSKDWFTAKELLGMNIKTDESNSLNRILPEKQIMVSFGPEKSLKSSTSIELALAMTFPSQWWYGIEITEPMKVLYIFFEGEPGELKDKQIRAMAKYPNADLDNIIFKYYDDLPVDTYKGISELNNLLSALPLKPDVIFIDPLRGCLDGDENDTRVHKRFLSNVMPLGYRLIIVHHRGKPGKAIRTLGEEARGSGVMVQRAHTIISYVPNPQKEEQITMKFKSRGPRPADVTIAIDDKGVISTTEPIWNPNTQEEKAQVAIWNLLSRHIDKLATPEKRAGELESEIAVGLGISERTVKKAWKEMESQGVVKVKAVGREKFLSVSPFELEPIFPL